MELFPYHAVWPIIFVRGIFVRKEVINFTTVAAGLYTNQATLLTTRRFPYRKTTI